MMTVFTQFYREAIAGNAKAVGQYQDGG